MKTLSLRARLLGLLIAGTVAVTLTGMIVADRMIESRLARSFDEALTARASVLATLTKLWPEGVELDFADEFMPEFTNQDDPAFFQLQTQEGRLIELSESFLFDGVPEGATLDVAGPVSAEPRLLDTVLPDGRRGRLVVLDFVPQLAIDPDDEAAEGAPGWRRDEGALGASPAGSTRPGATVAVAVSREGLDARIFAVRLALAGTGGSMALALALLAALALHVGLRPVERLARDVAALDERHLDARFDTDALPRELRPIGVQLEGLLERIARALDRERQLTSDIAHDLKTPVAELRALCDVGTRFPASAETTTQFFEDARDVARTLERTIDRLLILARHDAGRETVARTRFDLMEQVQATAAAFGPEAARRQVVLAIEGPESVEVESDRDRLSSILGNLLENAAVHSPDGAVATCVVGAEGDRGLAITVTNPAPDLTAADMDHVFERFWRKDASRREAAHAGLGLALARAEADVLGARLDARLHDGRFAATLVLPDARPGARPLAARAS